MWLSRRRRLLLFCMKGSAKLVFNSFSYTLSPGSVAAVDGLSLGECQCTAGTELLEYRPRGGKNRANEPWYNQPAFTVIPERRQLTEWADTVVSRVRSQVSLRRYDFCSVGVQLRDRSGGQIPYPFSCAEGCPEWGRCAATAAYIGTGPFTRDEQTAEPILRKAVTILVAIAGIGLWGGLLLYGMITEIMLLME